MKIKNFLVGVGSELKKVRWLKRKEAGKGLLSVLAVSSFVILFFYLIDFVVLAVEKLL